MPQNSHYITNKQAEKNRIWHKKDYYKRLKTGKIKIKSYYEFRTIRKRK